MISAGVVTTVGCPNTPLAIQTSHAQGVVCIALCTLALSRHFSPGVGLRLRDAWGPLGTDCIFPIARASAAQTA
jgi:hypothetical protein